MNGNAEQSSEPQIFWVMTRKAARRNPILETTGFVALSWRKPILLSVEVKVSVAWHNSSGQGIACCGEG